MGRLSGTIPWAFKCFGKPPIFGVLFALTGLNSQSRLPEQTFFGSTSCLVKRRRFLLVLLSARTQANGTIGFLPFSRHASTVAVPQGLNNQISQLRAYPASAFDCPCGTRAESSCPTEKLASWASQPTPQSKLCAISQNPLNFSTISFFKRKSTARRCSRNCRPS